jgi:hypothetical protein
LLQAALLYSFFSKINNQRLVLDLSEDIADDENFVYKTRTHFICHEQCKLSERKCMLLNQNEVWKPNYFLTTVT